MADTYGWCGFRSSKLRMDEKKYGKWRWDSTAIFVGYPNTDLQKF